MNGKKRKKSAAGAALEDDLPDHLHYYGNTPKINKEFPGVFSTPVIPFISRQWNYSHWIYRTDDDNFKMSCRSRCFLQWRLFDYILNSDDCLRRCDKSSGRNSIVLK